MSEPKADELAEILTKFQVQSTVRRADYSYLLKETEAQLRQYIDRKVLEGRIEELTLLKIGNTLVDTETGEAVTTIEDRIKELTDERGGDDE